jgi:nucleotide-binding universal stress UspA family protein
MQMIMVAIDLSERSDRALRRAAILAGQHRAELTLLHVVDDDQPAWLVDSQQTAAEETLERLAGTMRSEQGVDVQMQVRAAAPFQGISAAAAELKPDLMLIGPHRRQALKDMFTGTTAERAIRSVQCPVLMVNALPAGPYRHMAMTTDLSDVSAEVLRRFQMLGLFQPLRTSLLHIHDAPGLLVTGAFGPGKAEMDYFLHQQLGEAEQALKAFMHGAKLTADATIVRALETTFAHDVMQAAEAAAADLLVISTHGRGGVAKLLLGSVAERILAKASMDVLALPPMRTVD